MGGAAWIRGASWRGHPHVDRHLLDGFGFDRPVMVTNVSLQDAVVCSHGLDVLGIAENVQDPPAGRYGRDSAGRLTGHLFEQAYGPAHAASLEGLTDPESYERAIRERAQAFLREGITAIHDAACSPEAEAAYRRLADRGELPLSVLAMPHARAMFTDDGRRRHEGPRTGEGDEWVRVGPVKFFADGGNLPGGRRVGGPHRGTLRSRAGRAGHAGGRRTGAAAGRTRLRRLTDHCRSSGT